jgi:hypothetical protein
VKAAARIPSSTSSLHPSQNPSNHASTPTRIPIQVRSPGGEDTQRRFNPADRPDKLLLTMGESDLEAAPCTVDRPGRTDSDSGSGSARVASPGSTAAVRGYGGRREAGRSGGGGQAQHRQRVRGARVPQEEEGRQWQGGHRTLGKQASEYADCEEYTCGISRGADPRTTHILAGETVEVRRGDVGGGCRKVVFSIEPLALSDRQPHASSSSSPAAPARVVASSRCCCCMKRLLEDRDIFIYL